MKSLKEKLTKIVSLANCDKKTEIRSSSANPTSRKEFKEYNYNNSLNKDNQTNYVEEIKTKIQEFKNFKKENEESKKVIQLDFEVSREALNKYKKTVSPNSSTTHVELSRLLSSNLEDNETNKDSKFQDKTFTIKINDSFGSNVSNKADTLETGRKTNNKSNTVININNNSQNNNTIINKLTLNVVNNNDDKNLSDIKYKYISNIDSDRNTKTTTNNSINNAKNNFLLSSKNNLMNINTGAYDSSLSNKNSKISILNDFRRTKEEIKPIKPNIMVRNSDSKQIEDRRIQDSLYFKKAKSESLNNSRCSAKIDDSSLNTRSQNKIKNQINTFVMQLEKDSKSVRDVIKNKKDGSNLKYLNNFDAKDKTAIDDVSRKQNNTNFNSQLNNKYNNFISYQNKADNQSNVTYTRNLATNADEEYNEKQVFTFSRPIETQTFSKSFSMKNDLKIKLEDLKALRTQIKFLNEEEIKKVNDEYVLELKELANLVLKIFD